MSNYAIVLSARMSSERLPGKALAIYCPTGQTNLEQIIQRWRSHSRRAPRLVVATTTDSDDDVIAQLCSQLDVPCARGSRNNVVDRIDHALRQFAPDACFVARALADNPLVDVGLTDWRFDVLSETGADGLWYGGDESRLTYAATTDVWSRSAWDRITDQSSGSQLEHPGAFYWDNLSKFSVIQLPLPMREYLAPVRTELDTPHDLEMFRQLWGKFTTVRRSDTAVRRPDSAYCIPTLEALDCLSRYPEIAAINADVQVKTQTRAIWRKGSHWSCKSCQRRMGGVVAGDLEVRCGRCGKPQKFYAMPPVKPSMMRY